MPYGGISKGGLQSAFPTYFFIQQYMKKGVTQFVCLFALLCLYKLAASVMFSHHSMVWNKWTPAATHADTLSQAYPAARTVLFP